MGDRSLSVSRLDVPVRLRQPVARLLAESRPFGAAPRALTRFLLSAWLLGITLLAVVVAVGSWRDYPIALFTADPATLTGSPFYVGLVSHVGVLGWCAAATVCLFTAARLYATIGDSELTRFLFVSGALTALLLLDDLFLLHELVFPKYFAIPQTAVLIGYGLLTVAWLITFARPILRTAWFPLLCALALLSLSAGLDQIPWALPAHLLWEDGAKLLGIAAWLVYFAWTSSTALNEAPPPVSAAE